MAAWKPYTCPGPGCCRSCTKPESSPGEICCMSEMCEMPLHNASPEEVRQLLSTARTVAVVGLSDKPDRDSYHVAAYLQQHGYRIIPVNPAVASVLGEKAYGRLEDVPEKIDIVDIFRRPDAVPPIVESAI